MLPVDGRDVLLICLDQKPKEAWGCISLGTVVLLIALPAPRTVEGCGISCRFQAEEYYNQHDGDSYLQRERIGGMEYWRNGGL
jgi:hypothetical protein